MTAPGLESVLGQSADPALEAQVRSGLVDVEELLRTTVRSDYPFVTETSRHLVDAGGKRFRPLVVLLAAAFGDPAAAGVVPVAVAIELTHLATLYHDDVMDEAVLRRGAEAANSRWNNTVAILTGDFLFARASEITADLGTEATRILAQTIAVLCEGQIRETVGVTAGGDAVAHYLRVVEEKTAVLVATACRLGAMLAGADDVTVAALARFGELFGVAFQLSDDLLDIASESTDSGKTPGTDLREGIRTLPVLYVDQDAADRSAAADVATKRLQSLIGPDAAPLADGDVPEALALLRAHPAMGRARTEVERWSQLARAALAPLPDGPPKAALDALATFVVARAG